ncbi:XisI protein [Limnoraphis robusta]|uniref:XisI protein n=1 Tax=Limnoraphis robusta CCNP1315 TaxID=3110306 RepID=A0ABU5U069_9CYAN|nr:XisI protein [Limnoraphis robusta]MEA5520450.1 XisI protein [Limnoraphis robusta CCNP1315]MEA5546615.1 XisI protein [Limnoraphis robusta CCNP1324]
MDRQVESYQAISREIINDYARYQPSQGEIELRAIADGDSYLLISFGWNGDRRVHSTIIHLRIVDGKFWIERDETEEGVTQDLLDHNVPKSDIVLAFYHPEERKLTEFASA